MPREVVRSDAFIKATMRNHGTAVFRLAISQTGSKADAEDVYQDVFIALACCDTNFKDAEHLKAWLLRTTVNRCRDLSRSWWKRRGSSLETLTLDLPDKDANGEAANYEALWKAVRKLPERYRALVHLRYVEEMTCEQIADITDTNASTVRTRLSRAHQQLRTLLEESNETI